MDAAPARRATERRDEAASSPQTPRVAELDASSAPPGSAGPGHAWTPPPAPPAVPPLEPRRSPRLAVPRPAGLPARSSSAHEPSMPSPHPYGQGPLLPSTHPYGHGPLQPSPFYPADAPYPGLQPPHSAPPLPHQPAAPYPGPYYQPRPSYALAGGHDPYRQPAYPPPLPPRPAPGPYAQPLNGFAPDPRNAVPYPPPPTTPHTPPLPPGRSRASSASLFSPSGAKRWLEKTSLMLESKLDEMLQGPQGPPHRPAYGPGARPPGSYMEGGPPAPGHGGHSGSSWGGGSYRYA